LSPAPPRSSSPDTTTSRTAPKPHNLSVPCRQIRLHPLLRRLFNASLFAASILPISTAYAVCEGLGLESGLDKKFSEAPFFYWLYTGLIVAGAGVILWPNLPLVKITILSQVVNGAVLPFVLIAMLLLINKRELMGRHTNSRFFNTVAWLTTIIMIVLTIMLLFGGNAS